MPRTLFLFFLVVLAGGPAAQIPDGHALTSLAVAPGSINSGVGGLGLIDPCAPGCIVPVTGLPNALVGTVGTLSGANCLLSLEGGDVLVGNVTTGGLVALHRLTLAAGGRSVAAARSIPLGSAAVGGVPQLALVGPNSVLVVANFVPALPSLGAQPGGLVHPMKLARVDLVTGGISPVPLGGWSAGAIGSLRAQALATSPSGRAYVGINDSAAMSFNVWSFQPGAGVAPRLETPVALPGLVTSLTWSVRGRLVASVDDVVNNASALREFDPATNTWASLLSGWALAGSVADEPETGTMLFTGSLSRAVAGGVHRLDPATGAVTTLASAFCGGTPRGDLSGLLVSRSLATYGLPSGAGGVRWSDRPDPNRRACPCNGQFSLEVDGGALTLGPSGWIAGLSPAIPPTPFGPNLLLQVGPPFLASGGLSVSGSTARLSLPIPCTPSLRGQRIYLQSVLADSSFALHLTEGLRVSIL